MKYFYILLTCLSIPNAKAQTEPKALSTIKISVDTPVEVSVEKLALSFALTPPDEDYERFRDDLWDVKNAIEFDSDEQDAEAIEKINEELEKHKPLYVSDLTRELDAAGITKRIQIGSGELSEYYHDVVDTIVFVTVNNAKEMETINELAGPYPCEVDVDKTVYESEEKYDDLTYPILVEKATKKAKVLAKSMNKKIVGIEECTNVYPLSMRPRFYENIADLDFKLGNSYVSNAFDQTKIYYPSLIFTFILE